MVRYFTVHRALVQAPVGATPQIVSTWFDPAAEASEPVVDGTLASERDPADTFRRLAMAENTRRAYRSAVRADLVQLVRPA